MANRPDGTELLERLGERLRWRNLNTEETLFHSGDSAWSMFVVKKGRIRLIRPTPHGAEVTQAVAREGDTVAEAAMFTGSYRCDAIAEIPSRVAVISRDTLLDAIENDRALLQILLGLLASRLLDSRERLQLRTVRPASRRVWLYLTLVARGRHVSLDRPIRAVADELDLTPEALYRALASLKSEGRIGGRGRDLILLTEETPGS